MKDEALARLKCELPTTLEEFDEVDRTGWTHFTFPTSTIHNHEFKKLYAMIRFAAYDRNVRSIFVVALSSVLRRLGISGS